jgi:hypothetical protein
VAGHLALAAGGCGLALRAGRVAFLRVFSLSRWKAASLMGPRSRRSAGVAMRSPASRRCWHAVRSAKAWPVVANTGSRWSSRQMRSTFATGGCGAMSARRHPARSAWLAIRTKALSPRASQKDRLVRSRSSSPAWPAMAQPRAARPSAVARSSSAGARTTAIAAPEPAAVWVAPSVMTMPPFAVACWPPLSGSLCAGQDGTALSPQAGTKSLPAASTTGRRTSAVRRRRRTGTALARPARTRGGADPGGGTSSKDPMQAIVGPRHAGKPSGSTHICSGLSSTSCRANPVSPRSIARRPAS